jgi:6-phosphogluconolactonase
LFARTDKTHSEETTNVQPTRNRLLFAAASSVLALTTFPALAQTADHNSAPRTHAVFVMNNNAEENEILAYERSDYGTLFAPHTYKTTGRGSGGTVDPLSSQGSLTLSNDGSLLFAVNAGSGNLSVFAVYGAQLELLDKVPTGGSEPVSVAQHGNLVYVVNGAGSSSVVGFALRNGKLTAIPDSQRFLSANNVGPGSIAFSPDGKFLVVAERVTPSIDVFSVLPNGLLSAVTVNKNVSPGTFSVNFGSNDTAFAVATGTGGNTSTISSYSIQAGGTITAISSSVPTDGAATCWDAVTPNGNFIYTSNSGTSSISAFAVGSSGALTALPGTVVATNPSGSTNLDVAVSSDGKFLYSLNAASGTIGMFAIQPTAGTLTNLGTAGKLPASGGINGIAAN